MSELRIPCGPDQELIAIAVKKTSIRCRVLPGREIVNLRPAGGVRFQAEGEVLRVRPYKQWQYARSHYLSGEIIGSRIDGRVLAPVPLKLYERGVWDPYQEWAEVLDQEPLADLPDWLRGFLNEGPRPEYEMEQIIPGEDPDEMYDPIVEAAELDSAGYYREAYDLLFECLKEDLRCIDAYVHLGLFRLGDAQTEWSAKWAIKCYEAGVRVGEQALPLGFDGVLPWGWLDNRPFLRALHGFGLCQWRLGRFEEAGETLRRIFRFDPGDSLGVRFILPAVEAKEDYLRWCEVHD